MSISNLSARYVRYMFQPGSVLSLLLAAGVVTSAGCASNKVNPAAGDPAPALTAWSWTPISASAGVGGGNVRVDVASSSIQLPDYVPVRRYQDVFTFDGKNQGVVVEYGWSYKDGTTVETVRDISSGAVVSREDLTSTSISFTDRELELAIALAREHPQLRDVLAATDLNFYAGFAYRDSKDTACGERTRCVHVIVSAGDGQRHVAHAIVNLMARKVVHPFLDPDRKPDPIPLSQK